MQGQPVKVTTSYSDYRKTETGLKVPYGIGLDLGQFQLSTTVKKVEVNKTISQGHDGQNQSAIRKGSAGCLDLGIVAQVVFGLMHRHF